MNGFVASPDQPVGKLRRQLFVNDELHSAATCDQTTGSPVRAAA